ncbi:hypothetical protein cand_015260 [Cryptosporidium andersoni]|uniref:Uncharacterized protein n=1 Tax=Cryptosporidium andersoni TaxID=117008 RepID=A0A1J4MU64_9CRYT|nr:hypothetical protein cand_015260 [Cryptosporidium andersoni]
MTPNEILATIDENLQQLMQFVRVLSVRSSHRATTKCMTVIKNLKILSSVCSKHNISIHPLTTLCLNGILWLPEACSEPRLLLNHLITYELLFNSNSQNLQPKAITEKEIPENSTNYLLNNGPTQSNQLNIVKQLFRNQTNDSIESNNSKSTSNDESIQSFIPEPVSLPTEESHLPLQVQQVTEYDNERSVIPKYSEDQEIADRKKELEEIANMRKGRRQEFEGFKKTLEKVLSNS